MNRICYDGPFEDVFAFTVGVAQFLHLKWTFISTGNDEGPP
jgi:hypothetical protein